jgi:hypothetical protein
LGCNPEEGVAIDAEKGENALGENRNDKDGWWLGDGRLL